MRITISWYAHAKIMHWVHKGGSKECSGFGMVKKEKNHLHVYDAFMLPQENSGGATEIEPSAIAKELYNRRSEDGEMNFWWHSHHSMDAYMSQTDVDTINELGGNGWLVASVFNNKGKHHTVLFTKEPVEMYLDTRLDILSPALSEEGTKDANKMWDECNKEKVYQSNYNSNRDWKDWEWNIKKQKWTHIPSGDTGNSIVEIEERLKKKGQKKGVSEGADAVREFEKKNLEENWMFIQPSGKQPGGWSYMGEDGKMVLPRFLKERLADGTWEHDPDLDMYLKTQDIAQPSFLSLMRGEI